MTISITPVAADKVRHFLENNGGGVALKINLNASGCSGYKYDLDFVDAVGEDDEVFEEHGVKVLVEKKNMPFVSGMRLDYRKDGLNEGFAFDNPNVKNLCGCGESFQV